MGVAALAVVALPAAGCSWLFVHGPPPEHQQLSYVDCTGSNVLPTLDVIISAIGTLDAVGMLADGSNSSSARANKEQFGVLVGGAAAFAASSYYGYHRTAACRAAESEALNRAGMQVGYPLPFAPRPVTDPWIAHPAPTPRIWDPPPATPAPADAGSHDAGPDGETDAGSAP